MFLQRGFTNRYNLVRDFNFISFSIGVSLKIYVIFWTGDPLQEIQASIDHSDGAERPLVF